MLQATGKWLPVLAADIPARVHLFELLNEELAAFNADKEETAEAAN